MNNREFILVKISLVLVLLIPPGELSPRPLSVDDEFSRVDFGPIARNDYDQGDTGDETLGGSNTAFGFADHQEDSFTSFGAPAASVSDYYGDDEDKRVAGPAYGGTAPNNYDYGSEGTDGIGPQDGGQYQDNLPHPGVDGQAYPNYEDDYLRVGAPSPSDPFDF